MEIRHTKSEDMPRLLEIFSHAREYMAQNGNPHQWGDRNWPTAFAIEKDIKSNKSYVCEKDGKIVATFFLDYGPDIEPTYLNITDGAWLSNTPYCVIHRIASDGSHKGAGTYCINWALEKYGHMRIDTHGDNIIMQNLLKKLGFTLCGTIYIDGDNYPRLAFEKSVL